MRQALNAQFEKLTQEQHHKKKPSPGPTLTLAGWQLRQTWQLLIVIGSGLLIAVMLVCAVPLYVQVSMNASLLHSLGNDPFLTVHAQSQSFSAQAVKQVEQDTVGFLHIDLGSAVMDTPEFSLNISPLTVTNTKFLSVIGADITQGAADHVKVLKGRLPHDRSGNTIEFAMVAQGQRDLNLPLGKTFQLTFNGSMQPMKVGQQPHAVNYTVTFELVGIIAPADANNPYWQGETFEPTLSYASLMSHENVPALVSNDELMDIMSHIAQAHITLQTPIDIYWYYPFDLSHIDINHLTNLKSGLSAALTDLSNNPTAPPSVVGTTASAPLNAVLQSFANRAMIVQLPALCLAYLIASLALYFVIVMMNTLVEHQLETIALLRSRGASIRQVFGSLMGQSVGLGLISLFAGPLLAILLVVGLVYLTLAPADQGALHLIINDPFQVMLGQLQRSLLVVGLAVVGMSWSIWRVLRATVLVVRRDRSRPTYQPFWKRMRLDLVAAAISLVSFGFLLYLSNSQVLNVQARTLILPVISLIMVLFLLLCFLLLFLRLFPTFLNWGEHMAVRNRGAAPLLALAQMARVPGHALRMILLFALAISFALFTLIFAQTEMQRLADSNSYQVGADFEGTIPDVLAGSNWDQQLAFYRGIKGVTSVTLGTTSTLTVRNTGITIALDAVDSNNYANTIYWTGQESDQSLDELMGRLRKERVQARQKNLIPTIIDDASAQSLGVGMGQRFSLSETSGSSGSLTFLVVGVVHSIPTIYDTADGTGSDTSVPQGGMLVDFQTYSDIMQTVNQEPASATIVWVRSSSQPVELAQVRSVLVSGSYALVNGEDRRAQAQILSTDPLYETIVGSLELGTGMALLLGLLGNLLVTWWNVRRRRTSFAILRALGCKPGQIAWVLLWEQVIVYGTGTLLGILLGVIFSLSILPAFIFSLPVGAVSSEALYVAQIRPTVQIVMPFGQIVGLLVALFLLCVLALSLTMRVVIQPQVSQALRLNED